jgi:hypothetical protein
MAVPYTFASATTSIPLSQLDANFSTAATLGTTAVALGNTVTTINGLTLTGTTLTSPTLTTPVLGTPASGTLTNCTFPTLNQNTTGTAANVTGVVAVLNGGTGVTASSGASSVMLRDANQNVAANSFLSNFTTVVSAGTTTTLTVASAPFYLITGSTSHTFQLPNATTLVNGTMYAFNNNSSAGSVSVNNGASSPTLIATVGSGSYTVVTLLDNSTQAGSWDKHVQAPANVTWTTNTFDYAGSITSATWNGNVVAYNRGGTGQSSYATGDIIYASATNTLSKLAAGTNGYVLTLASGVPTWSAANGTTTNALTIGTGLSGTSFNGSAAVTVAIDSTVATLTGTQTLTNKTVTNPTVTNYTETLQAVGTVGASNTLALTNGTVLTATLTASTPCTFTMPTATAGKSFMLILTQAASGATTATFTGVKWPAGIAPTVTATASAVDIFSFVANGTNWYGSASQAFA